jgi:hypothetical protein
MTTERYFDTATAQDLRDAASACRLAAKGDDDNWDHPLAVDARRATKALGWSWDFTTWSHAAGVLEREAELAEVE